MMESHPVEIPAAEPLRLHRAQIAMGLSRVPAGIAEMDCQLRRIRACSHRRLVALRLARPTRVRPRLLVEFTLTPNL